MRARTAYLAATLLVALLFTALAAHAQAPYKILGGWQLTDSGGWDYLLIDSPAHRLYITRGDHVDVMTPRSAFTAA